MTKQRQQVTVDVHVILERDGRVLLSLRRGTGYADGLYCLPSGHLDPGESVVDCALHEAREEIGVTIDPGRLRPATVVHHLSPGGRPRVGFSFATDTWDGEVVNAEPDKCAKVEWVPADALPDNTVPYTAAGVGFYRTGTGIGVHGRPWADPRTAGPRFPGRGRKGSWGKGKNPGPAPPAVREGRRDQRRDCARHSGGPGFR